MRLLCFLVLSVTLLIPSLAIASDGEDGSGVIDLITQIVEAAKSGQWWLVAGAGLSLAMLGLRPLIQRTSWFRGDRGNAIAVMLLALGTSLAASFAAPGGPSLEIVLGAIAAAFTAVGGYTWVKRVLWPKDKDPSEGE